MLEIRIDRRPARGISHAWGRGVYRPAAERSPGGHL